jgi:hypothetical protein
MHVLDGVLVLGAAGVVLALLGTACSFGVGALLGMRCPRCGAYVVWLSSGWGRLRPRPTRLALCLPCRRLVRTERTGSGWAEAAEAIDVRTPGGEPPARPALVRPPDAPDP